MNFKKTLSFYSFIRKSFLNRKLIAFFIFVSLSVNGFAPSAAEVSKYSFVMVAAAVTQNIAGQILEKCDLSLSVLASDVYFSLFKILDGTPLKSSGVGSKEKEKPENQNVAGSGIKPAIFNKEIKILRDGNLIFLPHEKLTVNGEKGVTGERHGLLFCGITILFLMFIAAIVRRKDIIGKNVKINILTKELSV